MPVPAESEDPVVEPVDDVVDGAVVVVVDGVLVVDVGVAVVVEGVAVVDEGVAVVDVGLVVMATPALPDVPPTLPADVPSVDPVDTPEPSLPPTSALLAPPALPSVDEELDRELLLLLPSLLLLLLLSPLPLLETILVIGSVSVDVVCDCTMTGQVVAPAALVALLAAATRPASTNTLRARMLISSGEREGG